MMLSGQWRRRWEKLRAGPFLYPERGIVGVATLSGILLALGSGLVLTMFDGGVRHRFAERHFVGILLITASISTSWLAWLLQRWDADLQREPTTSPLSHDDKLTLFLSRHDGLGPQLWGLTLTSIFLVIGAFYFLFVSSPPEQLPNASQPRIKITQCPI